MGGVWDYEAVAYEDTGDWANSQEDGGVELVEDGDGNGRVAAAGKRGRDGKHAKKGGSGGGSAGANGAGAAGSRAVVLSEGGAGCSDSDSDFGFGSDDDGVEELLRQKRHAKLPRTDAAAALSLCSDDSKPTTPAGMHAHAGGGGGAHAVPLHGATTRIDASAQRALEQSRLLQQRMAALQEDDPDVNPEPSSGPGDGGLGGGALRSGSLSLRRTLIGAAAAAAAAARGGADTDGKNDDVALVGDGADAGRTPCAATGASSSGAGAAAASAAAAGPKLTLVCQCRQGSVSIKLGSNDPFSKLQRAFLRAAADKGWLASGAAPPPGFKLQFDGETLRCDDTPAGNDMEDEEKVDVWWKS
eukprot:365904-Chlamydomonas_euryale.AAC.10